MAPPTFPDARVQQARLAQLREHLARRILVLDGATGTYLQGQDLYPDHFGGADYEGCNEHLNLISPHVILEMHQGYLAAGSDIIETNTFGGTPLVLAAYGLADRTYDINR